MDHPGCSCETAQSHLRYTPLRGLVPPSVGTKVMSLKDEIEKIIGAERTNLEIWHQKNAEYHLRQRARFAPMAAVLQEIAKSIEPIYLSTSITETRAVLEIGQQDRPNFTPDLRWEIEPNYGIDWRGESGHSEFHEEAGVRVTKTKYCYWPEYSEFRSEEIYEGEDRLAKDLIENIAKEVARYRHSQSSI